MAKKLIEEYETLSDGKEELEKADKTKEVLGKAKEAMAGGE